MADPEQVALAAEVYLYSHPLVYELKMVEQGAEGGGPAAGVPVP